MDVISHLLTLLRRSEWHSYDRDRGYHGQYHIRALVWGGGVSISFHIFRNRITRSHRDISCRKTIHFREQMPRFSGTLLHLKYPKLGG